MTRNASTEGEMKHAGENMEKWKRALILFLGVLLGQVVLYSPCLLGNKVLLPLDILATPAVCIPIEAGTRVPWPQNILSSDLVLQNEPARRFAGAELRAGRFPLWNPSQYAGVPHTMLAFSPFGLIGAAFESPRVLAWLEVLTALLSGWGAYLFFRRGLGISKWPATIAAWCYPLTGFFILWQGYGIALSVVWLPWLLLAIHQTLHSRLRSGPVWVSIATFLVLVSGKLDVAGQVLLTSGLYATWSWWELNRGRLMGRQAMLTGGAVIAAWALGFLLAAPGILPLMEYAHTGFRMQQRGKGFEERPPIGLLALPQTVMPDMYGSNSTNSFRLNLSGIGPGDNVSESSVAAYTGLVATLFAAPLAWCSRRHRLGNVFWIILAFISLSWSLNIPGMVTLLRLPGLNMMSHNRFVFAGSFAVLAMAAVGLETLANRETTWRKWFWLPAGLLLALFLWNTARAFALPEYIRTTLPELITQGKVVEWLHDMDGVRRVQSWFTLHHLVTAALSMLGLSGWIALKQRKKPAPWLVPVVGLVLVADLLWFAHDRRTQTDRSLYYPPIPALEQIRLAGHDRVIGANCLPATLAEMYGLRDIRGYDAIDPARFIDLMLPVQAGNSAPLPYAMTMMFDLKGDLVPPDNMRLLPVLDMLGVRHVIFRGSPPSVVQPEFRSLNYWVAANRSALPRVFVPERVETLAGHDERISKITSPDFNPREVAYVEVPVNLPAQCKGTAELHEDAPTHLRVTLNMETQGLLVLTDLWDKGWHAYLEGKSVPILIANHAVRGVVVPAGKGTLEFVYEPASLKRGIFLSLAAIGVLLIWSLKCWLGSAGPRASSATK